MIVHGLEEGWNLNLCMKGCDFTGETVQTSDKSADSNKYKNNEVMIL